MACQVSHSLCHVKSNIQLHICRQATTNSSTFTLVVFIFASNFFQELYQAAIFGDLQDNKEVACVSKEGKTRRMHMVTFNKRLPFVFIYFFLERRSSTKTAQKMIEIIKANVMYRPSLVQAPSKFTRFG